MIQTRCPVLGVRSVADNVFVLTFLSPSISQQVQAGQFINVKIDDGLDPLLRRPFSVYYTDGDAVDLVFNVIGKGSSGLRKKRVGDTIDVLGPLGVPFSLVSPEFETAILVGGGMGVAPLPLSTRTLKREGKSVITCLGARTKNQLTTAHLENVFVATDDGSEGFDGNVVDLLRGVWLTRKPSKAKVFACGPTAMLRRLAQFVTENDIPCEVSLEGPMACGFGICQGCPVELVGEEKKYALMCKDGPTFDVRRVKI